jgi:basic membrane protein A
MEDEQIDHRFRILLVCTVIALLAAILLSILQFGVPARSPRMKVGFVLLASRDDSGWNHSQYMGIRNACSELDMELLLREHVPEHTGDCPRTVQELAAKGCKIIFLPSYGYLQEAHEIVDAHPEIEFCTNDADYQGQNIAAYAIRIYQARYLAGILAGRQTKTGVIGYVAAMPNSEVNRGVNAFALGVQHVNPTARVKVCWTGSWNNPAKEWEAVQKLQAAQADLITYHVDGHVPAMAAEEAGLDFIGFQEALDGYSSHNLTSVACNWNSAYLDVLQKYQRGEKWDTHFFWKGLEQGLTGLSGYSERVSPELQVEIEQERQAIMAGRKVFSGEIYDQQGRLHCQAGEVIPDEVLLQQMYWLVKGVDSLE